ILHQYLAEAYKGAGRPNDSFDEYLLAAQGFQDRGDMIATVQVENLARGVEGVQLTDARRARLSQIHPVFTGARYAGPPAVPDYEVKFFLDPARALNNLDEPSRVVHDALELSSSVTKLRMLFLDSKKHDLNEVGWNVRLRTIEAESGIELAYKKRFRIGDRPLSQLLEQAASEGFGADDTNYRAQVEWGSRRTLSFTCKKTAHVRGMKGVELPEETDARTVAV